MSARRLGREFAPAQREQIADASGGHTPATLTGALLRTVAPDAIAEFAEGRDPGSASVRFAPRPHPAELAAARQPLIATACAPFEKPALR